NFGVEFGGDGFDIESSVESVAQLQCAEVRAAGDVQQGEALGSGAVVFSRTEPETAKDAAAFGLGVVLDVDEMDFRAKRSAESIGASKHKEGVGKGLQQLIRKDALARVVEAAAVEYGVDDVERTSRRQPDRPEFLSEVQRNAFTECLFRNR